MGLNVILQVDARKAGGHIEGHKQVNFITHLHVFLIQTKCCICYPFPTELHHARSFVEHVVKAPKADEAAQAAAHFRSRLAGNPKPESNRSLNPTSNPNLTPTLGRDRYLNRQMKRLIQFRCYHHVDLYVCLA